MGCDIHMIGEKRIIWDSKDKPEPWEVFAIPGIFQQRFYGFFAKLGNVRNYYDVPSLTDRRWWPDDMSDRARRWTQGCLDTDAEALLGWPGDHSFGWASLEEIKTFDWTTPTIVSGIITKDQYKVWDGKRPESYSGGISGPKVKVMYLDRALTNSWVRGIGESAESIDEATHIEVSWEQPLVSQEFIDRFIQALENEREWDNEEVRILFGFDS